MDMKLGAAIAGACMAGAVLVSGLVAPSAFARDDHGHGGGNTHGGHCDYGRGSINVMPQCNTSGGSAPETLHENPGTLPPAGSLPITTVTVPTTIFNPRATG